MIGWLQRNPLFLGLAVLAAVLAAILAFEVSLGDRAARDVATRKVVPAEPRLLPPLASVTPEQAYPETTARPLFAPTRRPAPEATAAPAAPAFQRGQFVLQGVIVRGDQRTAMLREKASGRIHRLEPGKEVNGLKVVQIEPEVVTLGLGDEREVLPLTVQRAAAAPPVAGVPGAPAVAQGPFGPQRPGEAPAQQAQRQPPAFAQIQPGAAPAPGQPGGPPVANVQPGTPVAGAAAPNPSAPGTPNVSTFPMSAEELLARRRARRAQQSQ